MSQNVSNRVFVFLAVVFHASAAQRSQSEEEPPEMLVR